MLGELTELLVTVSVPLDGPNTVGVNVIIIEQAFPEGNVNGVAPQLPVPVLTNAGLPDRDIPLTFIGPPPVLVREVTIPLLVALVYSFPKASVLGSNVVVDCTPCPVRVIDTTGALLLTVNVPLNVVADVGVNVKVYVQNVSG